MGKFTDKNFAPEPPDYVRRRFMIAGDKVILRALEHDDLERCYRWMNDPMVVRALKSRYPMPFHTEAEWLENATSVSATERHFAIERKDDRVHIGNASLHGIDWVSRTAAFGFFIGDSESWHKGYGSDGVRALVRFSFEEMNLRKLKIKVFDYNDRAKLLLSGLGFAEEGKLEREFFREGKYQDIVIFSVFSDVVA